MFELILHINWSGNQNILQSNADFQGVHTLTASFMYHTEVTLLKNISRFHLIHLVRLFAPMIRCCINKSINENLAQLLSDC